MSIRIRPGSIPQTLAFIKSKWDEFVPRQPFEFFFLDDDFDSLYKTEQKAGQLFSAFATLAILVACLGLFGLASSTAEQQTKEIGIRKVLGASAPGVVLLLSKEFMKWVLIANVIAWPVAYFAMGSWLENFAYRISLGWAVFVVSAALALGIALITVGFQAAKAALASPADALRYE